MKRRYIILIVIAAVAASVLLALDGFTLASGGGDDGGSLDDRLAGMIVTREYLDLFDFESYFEDNINDIMNGGMIDTISSTEYSGRIYAVPAGGTEPYSDFVFEGIEGIEYFHVRVEGGGESYNKTQAGEGMSDGATHLNVTDEGTEVTLEGTIYYANGYGEYIFYFNPVYQTPEGEIYCMSGQGFHLSGDYGVGGIYSQTMDHEVTITENGEKQTYKTSVKVSIETIYAPELIRVLQFDERNALVSSAEYLPGEVPAEIGPERGTAYFIVESISTGAEGKTLTERQIISPDESTFSTFAALESGICVKRYTNIGWE